VNSTSSEARRVICGLVVAVSRPDPGPQRRIRAGSRNRQCWMLKLLAAWMVSQPPPVLKQR